MTESPTKQDIDAKIQLAKDEQEVDEQSIKNLRSERAVLFVKNPNDSKIVALDKRIATLCSKVENTPAVLAELENQLAAVNQRIAQQDKDKLSEQQNISAREVEKLSQQFIEHLMEANDANQNLVAALSAEAGLAAKTGQQVLNDYCHGSMESLSMLLETMNAQMQGQHITVSGPGIVSSNVPIRL